jgi:hypothetical protein
LVLYCLIYISTYEDITDVKLRLKNLGGWLLSVGAKVRGIAPLNSGIFDAQKTQVVDIPLLSHVFVSIVPLGQRL